MDERPVIVWFRRDLRLDDHPALTAAVEAGAPVIPLFLHDETVEALGAAPRWRLGLGVEALAAGLDRMGARLILRRGRAQSTLEALVAETGARAVFWTRYYEPAHIARDTAVKASLKARGIAAQSFPGALLADPREVTTGAGTPYSVFTPFWRAVRARDPGRALAPPARLPSPARWPASDQLQDWRMEAAMNRGADVVRPHLRVGEGAALVRLDRFLDGPVARYAEDRDRPDRDATSGLSENLAWGEISPRRIWSRALMHEAAHPGGGAEAFLRELGWREFAWHLMAHFPRLAEASWRAGWDGFPWRADTPGAERWRRGATGEALVDAGLREMYVTGRMHNRVRMVVASYLTKHLLTDWRVGLSWFADCLVDWDPAANALNWQWVAGSGPDAAPYFRIFNPATQAGKFDPAARYRRRFLAEGETHPEAEALAYFRAIPRSWIMSPADPVPQPAVGLDAGRQRALATYARFRGKNA